MRIALYSSKRDRCGISQYTSYLQDEFRGLGHEVEYFSSVAPPGQTIDMVRAWRPDVFHVQHEFSIMPSEGDLIHYARQIKEGGARVALTCHTEDPSLMLVWYFALGGPIIVHKPALRGVPAHVVQMPCPVFDNLPDKLTLRAKYGLPQDAFIVSTVGFMIPWKAHPEIVAQLMSWLGERQNVALQVIASQHFNPELAGYAETCAAQLGGMASFLRGRIFHIAHYPPDRELIERLAASDLGYAWCPMDTGSNSAAAAQFIAARVPVVITDSTHYQGMGAGCAQTPKDMGVFVQTIRQIADDVGRLAELRRNQEASYAARNYRAFAQRHLELYRG